MEKLNLRRAIKTNQINATNLFDAPNWSGGINNEILIAAIEFLERKSAMLGMDDMNPLERLAALVLVRHYEATVGPILSPEK